MRCSACGRDTVQTAGGVCVACSATRAADRPDPTASGVTLDPATSLPGESASPSPALRSLHGSLTPGTSFGSRYRIIRLLGAGGMGAVYHAWDDELGEAVALKVIRPEGVEDPLSARGLERRFKRELVLARQVTHRNVVRIHDLGEIDGVKYLTMPYIQGSDLAALLRRERTLPIERAVAIARQVARGLQAAHEAGVIHRDLKPANIMLDPDDRAIIMDFGIARSISGGLAGGTVAGAVVGTLEYMAPEQAMAQAIDHRADIYAFGLILNDMLVGRRPSSRAESAVAELMDRIQAPLPSARTLDPAIPEALDQVIARCVQPDPAARFRTTAELVEALDDLDGGDRGAVAVTAPTRSRLPGTPAPPVRTAAAVLRQPRVLAAAGLAAALVLVALAFFWRSTPEQALAPSAPPATSVAILPFRNATGDAALDWIGASLASMMKDAVGSQSIRTVPSDRIHQILRDLRLTPGVEPDESTLRRLAEFSAADHVLSGAYVRVGSRIRVDATIRSLDAGAVHEVTDEAADETDLAGAVSRLSAEVRRHVGGDGAPVTAAASVAPTTESVDALRAFTEGLEFRRLGRHLDALKQFERAVAVDDGFALAFSKLGETYASLGRDTDAARASREAVLRAEQLPSREKYEVLGAHARVIHDHGKAIDAYERLRELSPRDSQVLFDLANLYEATGAYDDARRTFEEVLRLDPQFGNALFALARVEIQRRNPEAALEYLNRALSLAIQTDNDELRGRTLNSIGIAYKRLGKPEDAVRYYSESLEIRRRIGDTRGVANSLTELGQVHARLNRHREALASFQEALAITRELNDRRSTGNVLLDLGNLYTDRGDYGTALDMYKESLQIQLDLGDRNYEGRCLNNIGNVYLLQARYDEALTYFERGLGIWETLELPAFIADTLHNIAEARMQMGQYDQALSAYLRALQLRREAGDGPGAAIESFSMGAIFEQQGRYAAALDARQDALKTLRELNDPYWLGEILIGTASTLVLMGRSDQARELLEEAQALARDLRNARLTALALNVHGSSFLYDGDFQAARPLFDQARRALDATDPSVGLAIRLNLARLDVRTGRARAAIEPLQALARQAEELRMKPLGAECALTLGEALLAAGRTAAAHSELETAVAQAEAMGLRSLAAQAHYVLARTLEKTGEADRARRHVARAKQAVETLHKEAQTDDLLARGDLRPILDRVASLR